MLPSRPSAAAGLAAPPTLAQIFLAFTKIGLTSFGGGVSGWMLREFVQKRRWLDETEFLNGFALAQAFPGVNVVNLSIWIGFRLRGGPGALVGALGMVVPAMLVAIGAAALFTELSRYHAAHVVLAGVGAAAIGLALQTGVFAARRAVFRARSVPVPAAIMAATFLAIFPFRVPLLWVVLVMAPLSILYAALQPKREG
jgi:chromate transporter